MSAPIILISHQRIKAGKLEGYKAHYLESVERIQASRPRTLAHIAYLSQDGTQASVVMVFPDAEAMQLQMQGLGEAPRKTQEYMDFVSLQIYGTPNEATVEIIHKIAGSGVAVTITPQPIGGYTRFGEG